MKLENFKIRKIIKYFIHLLIIVIATKIISENRLDNKRILLIGTIGAISFGTLDLYAPSISESFIE